MAAGIDIGCPSYTNTPPAVGNRRQDDPYAPPTGADRSERGPQAAVSESLATIRPQPRRFRAVAMKPCQTALVLRCATVSITVGIEISAQSAAPRNTQCGAP